MDKDQTTAAVNSSTFLGRLGQKAAQAALSGQRWAASLETRRVPFRILPILLVTFCLLAAFLLELQLGGERVDVAAGDSRPW